MARKKDVEVIRKLLHEAASRADSKEEILRLSRMLDNHITEYLDNRNGSLQQYKDRKA
ncbi:MAG: hypothetical protein ACOX27_00020 [Caldicoprobacterales bacterium]|jgi:hypothetical protein|nr:hypothetical protein [Clostridiales bacterium]